MSQIISLKIKKDKKEKLKEIAEKHNTTVAALVKKKFRELLIESGLPTI
jgi:hypothetical protein